MRPSASSKIRSARTFSASRSACSGRSSWVTPSSTSSPGPISETRSPPTVTEARETRWTSALTVASASADIPATPIAGRPRQRGRGVAQVEPVGVRDGEPVEPGRGRGGEQVGGRQVDERRREQQQQQRREHEPHHDRGADRRADRRAHRGAALEVLGEDHARAEEAPRQGERRRSRARRRRARRARATPGAIRPATHGQQHRVLEHERAHALAGRPAGLRAHRGGRRRRRRAGTRAPARTSRRRSPRAGAPCPAAPRTAAARGSSCCPAG